MRFAYTRVGNLPTSLVPRLRLTLSYRNQSVEVVGLIDSGAMVNVLPYSAGIALGALWEEQTTAVRLTGNLARYEARALVVMAAIRELNQDELVQLVFAWSRSDEAPVIFGQMNFFLEFDVCFFRAEGAFEITRRSASPGHD